MLPQKPQFWSRRQIVPYLGVPTKPVLDSQILTDNDAKLTAQFLVWSKRFKMYKEYTFTLENNVFGYHKVIFSRIFEIYVELA